MRFGAVFLVVVFGSGARAQSDRPLEVESGHRVEPKGLLKQGERACARHDWDEAVQDFREALKIAPDDARLREKFRRALDRRARVREATAARPPPEPPGMSDGERDPDLVPMFKNLRWKARRPCGAGRSGTRGALGSGAPTALSPRGRHRHPGRPDWVPVEPRMELFAPHND